MAHPAKPEESPQGIPQNSFYYLQGFPAAKTLIEQRLERIDKAVPLSDELALLQSYTLRVQLLCKELQLLLKTLEQFDQQIRESFSATHDRPIFQAFPGPDRSGAAVAGQHGLGARTLRPARQFCIASVEWLGDQAKRGQMLHPSPLLLSEISETKFTRNHAKESILHSRWAAAYYRQQRNKGCGHHTAVRALAYKWQRIIWKCWQTRTVYKEAIYEAALKKKQKPFSPCRSD